MATVEEVKITGRKYRIWDEVNSIWKRISYWTKASDVEFDDGQNAEEMVTSMNQRLTSEVNRLSLEIAALRQAFSQALTDLKNTAIAKAVGANGTTFASVISKLATIVNRGAWSANMSSSASVTIPAGYHNGAGTVRTNGTANVTTNGTHNIAQYTNVNVNVQTAVGSLTNLIQITSTSRSDHLDYGYIPAVIGKTYFIASGYSEGWWSDDEPDSANSDPFISSGATTIKTYRLINHGGSENQYHVTKANLLIVRATSSTIVVAYASDGTRGQAYYCQLD